MNKVTYTPECILRNPFVFKVFILFLPHKSENTRTPVSKGLLMNMYFYPPENITLMQFFFFGTGFALFAGIMKNKASHTFCFKTAFSKKSKGNIIIVDDEVSLLDSLVFTLKRAHYAVTTFSDGAEAFENIQAEFDVGAGYDMLVTDLRMPGLSGQELIEEITKLGLTIPILVISNYGTGNIKRALLEMELVDYLDKPFSTAEFMERITKTFSKKSNTFASKWCLNK
ncbi:MAG: response regulator [Fibrobacteria bacterium]|nr:response regulator [Fibrobacteria bacterium]